MKTQDRALTIGLVGNPNSGKTTVFNALTQSRQRVGNWPGVTVERKTGVFEEQDYSIKAVDLPGTYSLTIASETSSIDEQIACEFVLTQAADLIVNVLDGNNLERNLYLTMQLLEMRVPMVVAVNMLDVARQRGIRIELDKLAAMLGCPVVGLEASKEKGIAELKRCIVQTASARPSSPCPKSQSCAALFSNHTCHAKFPKPLQDAIQSLATQQNNLTNLDPHWLATRLLEDDVYAHKLVNAETCAEVKTYQETIRKLCGEDADILLADARYQQIQRVMATCVSQSSQHVTTWTARIDNIVLNRFLGIPIFLAVMYGMFLFAINIGGAFQDFFDISSDTIFVQGAAHVLAALHAPTWLIALLANGVGKGINTTVTFIPVIGAMFLFLALLEDSGYMSRAAFVVDRLMRALGLPGKSFVPMIIGFGCNVPAVMAARTLENKRDRILTVMMSPFMSCGARLAIYAVFTAAFFPVGGQNVVFALYLIGIIMAMLTGLMLRKTVLKGDPAPMVMELPPYHVPNFKTLWLHAWQRLKGFVLRAGKLIIPICVLIGVLGALNFDGSINAGEGDTHSLLSALGRFLTPIFSPMGIHQDNWPATVGLLTGVLAKEVVVGTLNALYSQVGHLGNLHAATFHFWSGIRDAIVSIPTNLSQLGDSLGNPVLAIAPVHTLTKSVYGLMYQRFDGQVGAMAYLLFVLLYFPCVSTTAVMLRELNRSWTLFSVLWSTGVAYCVAVGFYQLATFAHHPLLSACWLLGIAGVVCLAVIAVRVYAGLSATFKTKVLPEPV